MSEILESKVDEHIDQLKYDKYLENEERNNMNKEITYKEIWNTLRAVDCSKVVVQKMGLDYIGWADAWSLLMSKYPQATYVFDEPAFYGIEGKRTCMVTCTIYIDKLERSWSLPIMTASMPMKSIPEPSSRDISDGQARCFVKAMGLFGLGLHLWEKRDVKQPKRNELHDKPF